MRVEVWADVLSPWTYIAKRRLEAALAVHDGDIEVVWRPHRVDPAAPTTAAPLIENFTGMDSEIDIEPLTRPFEGMPEVAERRRIAEIAAEEGLGPRFGALWRVDSTDAQRLIHFAYTDGGPALQDTVLEAVLRAHHIDGEDIGDPEVLARLATTAGFSQGVGLLRSEGGRTDFEEELLRGKAIGVRATPTFTQGFGSVQGAVLEGGVEARELGDFLNAAVEERAVPEETLRLRHAEALLGQRDPLGALRLLEMLLRDHPYHPDVIQLAARAYFASAQLNKALVFAEAMVEANPADFFARRLLGRTLQRLGRHDEAKAHLRLVNEVVDE